MKRVLYFVIALSLLAGVFGVCGVADKDYNFNAVIEASSDSYNVGDEFYVKISLSDIVTEQGFIGYQFSLKYDPSFLLVVEDSEGGFAEETLPENWNEGSERIELLEKDGEGKQTGKIKLAYISPLEVEDLSEVGINDNSFYVNIRLKCIAETNETVIGFDGDTPVNCTVFGEDGNIYNISGKTTELKIGIKSDGSGKGGILLYALASVAAVAVIIISAIVIKKKNTK